MTSLHDKYWGRDGFFRNWGPEKVSQLHDIWAWTSKITIISPDSGWRNTVWKGMKAWKVPRNTEPLELQTQESSCKVVSRMTAKALETWMKGTYSKNSTRAGRQWHLSGSGVTRRWLSKWEVATVSSFIVSMSLSLSFSLFLFLLQEVEWEASFHKNSQLPQEKLLILGFLAAVHSCHDDSHQAGSPAEFPKNPCSENGSKGPLQEQLSKDWLQGLTSTLATNSPITSNCSQLGGRLQGF